MELPIKEDIPTERECRALWTRYHVPQNVIAHSRLVAGLAKRLGLHLNRAGLGLDIDLLAAAGLLHDLSKGQRDHARIGARILEGLGFGRVGRIVAAHTDMPPKDMSLDESDLIYLVDKCAAGDRIVPLEERLARSWTRFAGRPDILQAVARRFEYAQAIQDQVEEILGVPVEDVIGRGAEDLPLSFLDQPRRIYLIRPGAGRPSGNGEPYIGPMDLPLSDVGIRPAESRRDGRAHPA
ncbi:MAG: HD domain-containing protein [Deltaproteobacteria bacterium]|nr:HD domain-containing protein [Deltaproteobacteria bacterium]